LRAVLQQSMPPKMLEVSDAFYARVSFSDASVLQDWITNCM
jgi:hypothetical protein